MLDTEAVNRMRKASLTNPMYRIMTTTSGANVVDEAGHVHGILFGFQSRVRNGQTWMGEVILRPLRDSDKPLEERLSYIRKYGTLIEDWEMRDVFEKYLYGAIIVDYVYGNVLGLVKEVRVLDGAVAEVVMTPDNRPSSEKAQPTKTRQAYLEMTDRLLKG